MARRGDANQAVNGKALPEMSALKPYWGKPAVRNFREGDGNNGIIEARSAPSPYSTRVRIIPVWSNGPDWYNAGLWP